MITLKSDFTNHLLKDVIENNNIDLNKFVFSSTKSKLKIYKSTFICSLPDWILIRPGIRVWRWGPPSLTWTPRTLWQVPRRLWSRQLDTPAILRPHKTKKRCIFWTQIWFVEFIWYLFKIKNSCCVGRNLVTCFE
jgi:hypothetical protein